MFDVLYHFFGQVPAWYTALEIVGGVIAVAFAHCVDKYMVYDCQRKALAEGRKYDD